MQRLSAGYRRQYLLSDSEGERKTVGKTEITGGRTVGNQLYISFLYQLQQWDGDGIMPGYDGRQRCL